MRECRRCKGLFELKDLIPLSMNRFLCIDHYVYESEHCHSCGKHCSAFGMFGLANWKGHWYCYICTFNEMKLTLVYFINPALVEFANVHEAEEEPSFLYRLRIITYENICIFISKLFSSLDLTRELGYSIQPAYEAFSMRVECETLPDSWDLIETIDKVFE